MAKLSGLLTPEAMAEIARSITVAALDNANMSGARGTTADVGSAVGQMFALALKEIANAEV
jgi:hypothetical protein